MKILSSLAILALLCSSVGAKPDLELTLTSARAVLNSEGGAQVSGELPGDEAMAGDIVIYRIAYTNVGDSPAVNPSLTGIIPEGTVIRPSESRPQSATITYSADGAKTYHAFPLTEDRTTANGVTVSRSVPLMNYTHVRFKLSESVAPGQSGQVEFRVRVQ